MYFGTGAHDTDVFGIKKYLNAADGIVFVLHKMDMSDMNSIIGSTDRWLENVGELDGSLRTNKTSPILLERSCSSIGKHLNKMDLRTLLLINHKGIDIFLAICLQN
jgi:hypothetical protein